MLSLVMVFSCCNLGNVLAAEETGESCGEFATFELSEDGVLVISGKGMVENSWADFADEITSLVVEEGITGIAGSAFEGCVNLAAVELPEGLEGIGQDAFYGCSSLKEINFPKTLVKISSSAFEGCTSLKKVELPEAVIIIETKVFYGCTGLEEVVLSEKTNIIKADAFSRCESLDVITIPESVNTIETTAFNKVPTIHNLSEAAGSPWGALELHTEPADNCPKCFTGDYVCLHKEYSESFKWEEDFSACTATFVCENCKDTHVLECEVAEEITAPTCTEEGKIVYVATCKFNDSNRSAYEQVVLEATGHQWSEGVVTKEPTEETTGIMVYSCEVCELDREEILEKLGHKYAITDVWSEDKSVCTAVFTCLNCDDVKEVDCEVKSNETPATCTKEGKIVYIATCEFNGTAHLIKCDVEDIVPATGHSFVKDPAWDWAEDMKTATAIFSCASCDETEELECKVVSEEVDGKIIYYAECIFEQELFEDTKVETIIPFTDIEEGKWYYEYVIWAYENEVADGVKEADGTYTFRPEENCTRAQFVQFLYNIAGTKVSEDVENPFTDIAEGKWYYNAVMWAVENGVTNGIKEADGTYTFRPEETCTRAQAARFIYNLVGEGAVASGTENPFTDIEEGKWYYNAILWGVEEGIINGMKQADGTYKFVPEDNVTRAQVVKMISCAYDDAAVEGIALTETEIMLSRGSQYQLEYVLNPSYAENKDVKWTSSDKTIARVSSRGVVTAIGYGPVTITATTKDGGFAASCVVNVIDPELTVSVAFDVVWVEVEGQEEKVQSLAVSAAAAGGSEVYDEYTIQVYESDTLVLEAANQKVIVTPAVSGKTYQAVVTVKDSRGTVATAEKNIVFSE